MVPGHKWRNGKSQDLQRLCFFRNIYIFYYRKTIYGGEYYDGVSSSS